MQYLCTALYPSLEDKRCGQRERGEEGSGAGAEQCAGCGWDRVNFLHCSSMHSMELCLGFVLKTVLMTQSWFCCCCAALAQSRHFLSHLTSDSAGDAQEIGRRCSHSSSDSGDTPHQMESCSALKPWGRRKVHPAEMLSF